MSFEDILIVGRGVPGRRPQRLSLIGGIDPQGGRWGCGQPPIRWSSFVAAIPNTVKNATPRFRALSAPDGAGRIGKSTQGVPVGKKLNSSASSSHEYTLGLPGFDVVSRDCFAGFRATGYNRPQPINANTNAIDAEYEALCAEYAGALV
jgi:hypothetical protein